jgi:hypothetical protein
MRSILAIVLVASVVAPAAAGSIRGSIRLPAPPVADATFRPYAGRASSLPAPARPARGQLGDAVVYVESLPAGAPQPPGQPRLPAGRYRVHWWHPDFAGGASDVEVPAEGAAALEVDFR